MSAPKVVLLCASLAACAGPTASVPADAVWASAVVAPQRGNAGLVLEIHNEVTSLGTLMGVAAVLDGALVFRQAPWRGGAPRPLTFWTTGGRHQLCVVAHYQGGAEGGAFVVRAPRLVDLLPGASVSARVRLQQQLLPQPYASAQYQGGLPYADTTTLPDPAKYESRLDELCGNRPQG
jgi:hypothetical protein